MHEVTFAGAVCQDQHSVLGLRLLDMSIGHRLILLKQKNPVYCAVDRVLDLHPAIKLLHLIEAVYTCAIPASVRRRMEAGQVTRWEAWRNNRVVSKWHKKRKRVDWNLDDEIRKFKAYSDQSSVVTAWADRGKTSRPFLPTQPSKDAGREYGGPYDAGLIQFTQREFGLTYDQALDFPILLAQIHFMASMERDGSLQIMNWDEIDFKLYAETMDMKAAKAAGFDSIEEHVEHIKAQSEIKKRKKV